MEFQSEGCGHLYIANCVLDPSIFYVKMVFESIIIVDIFILAAETSLIERSGLCVCKTKVNLLLYYCLVMRLILHPLFI